MKQTPKILVSEFFKRSARLAASFSSIWLIQEICDKFDISFLSNNLIGFVLAAIVVFLSWELGLIYITINKNQSDFFAGLIRQMQIFLTSKNYEAILRHRQNLSRSLWIEGKQQERVQLGVIAEEAAVKLKDKRVQIAILIDDLGWSLVAMKKFEQAMRHLKHGLNLAESEHEYYWIAKAHRHIAGIFIEANKLEDASIELTNARNAADRILSVSERNEMLAGILYGQAVLALKQNKPKDALSYTEESTKLRLDGSDRSRIVKILSLKGKIAEALGDLNSAKDFYRQGLVEAEAIGRLDEVIRNHMGLSRIFEQEHNQVKCEEHLSYAKTLLEKTPVPFEIDEKEFHLKLIKN